MKLGTQAARLQPAATAAQILFSVHLDLTKNLLAAEAALAGEPPAVLGRAACVPSF